MNKIAASLFVGFPIVAFACGGPFVAAGHEGPDAAATFRDTTSDNDGAVLPGVSPSGPIVAGDGGLCDASPQGVLGTKITLNVRWPATALVAKGSGTVSLWLLLRYAVDGRGAIAGTVQTCGLQMPVFLLVGLLPGGIALPTPESLIPRLQITIPAGSWDGTPTTPVTGAYGGSSIGSTFAIDPVVTLFGLKPTSSLAHATQRWIESATDLVTSDLTYADGGAYQAGVGEPGIPALPLSTPPDVLPNTSLATTSPQADQLWLALRTQFSLYGSVQSCTERAGTVEADNLDPHVVGCHLVEGGPCTVDQDVFLDGERSPFGSPVSGSFRAIPMVHAGCNDVLAKLP